MKPLNLIIILLVALLINNLILLNFVGYFEDKPSSPEVLSTDTAAPVASEVELDVQMPSEPFESVDESSTLPTNEGMQERGDEAFVESFQRVATTGVFTDIMDNWQMQAQKRYMQFSRELADKTEDELYELAMNSDSRYQQQTAMQKLMQGNMARLSVDKLKALYHSDNVASWSKSQILGVLLDKDDVESVELAKQVLQDDPDYILMGSDLLQRVYEKDPKFVARYIEDVGLDSRYTAHAIVSLLQQEPEIAESYMSKHFDQILESDNRWVHDLSLAHIDFKLSDRHQESLLAMMSADSRQTRQFALGFAHRIEDMDALRNVFGTLKNDRDKKQFLTSMAQLNPTTERRQLARQLASELDDPEIQRQFQ